MSVLRKRSPLVLPAAGLLLGALALGLAGCGGDEGGLSLNNIPVQLPVALLSGNPTDLTAGNQGTLTSGAVTPGTTGDVLGATVTIPADVLQQGGKFGIEIVPSAESTIVKLVQTNPKYGDTFTPVAELQFGPVDANGRIDVSRPIVFARGGVTIEVPLDLQGKLFGLVNSSLANGSAKLVVYRNVNGVLVPAPNCIASLDRTKKQIVLTGDCSGDIVVVLQALHPQGAIPGG